VAQAGPWLLRPCGEGGREGVMKRFKLWKWEIAIVWDFRHYHVSKNPTRKPKYQTRGE
jgi:hypothetical protein